MADLVVYKIRKDGKRHRHETQFPIENWQLERRMPSEFEAGTNRLVISVSSERFAISLTEAERQGLIKTLSSISNG